jgi:hypothetical protein
VSLPADVRRIDLPVRSARVLARVALGDDWDKAVALQHQITVRTTGTPTLPEIPKTPIFDLENLPGVEAFDAADIALDSERDLNPGMEPLQEKARTIAWAVKDPEQRARVDKAIRTVAFADFAKAGPPIGHGTIRNGWARPAVVGAYNIDYLARTLINESMRSCGAVRRLLDSDPRYCRSSCRGTSARMRHAASHPESWSASAGADEPRGGSTASAASWQNVC